MISTLITFPLPLRFLLSSAEDSKVVADFKATVATSLQRRMDPANTEKAGRAALLASALDPRHKHLRFLPLDVQVAVREQVAMQYNGLPEPVHREEDDVQASDDEPQPGPVQPKKKKTTLTAFFGEDYAGGEPSPGDELERYWAEPPIPLTEDPLLWWGSKERSFPKLYRLAMRYLCIPATSVPSERVFSAAGLIVSRLRSRLLPEHVDMLIALNKNVWPE